MGRIDEISIDDLVAAAETLRDQVALEVEEHWELTDPEVLAAVIVEFSRDGLEGHRDALDQVLEEYLEEHGRAVRQVRRLLRVMGELLEQVEELQQETADDHA